ncbi:GNAT family N-acetyltransferase [Flavobacteriaceae bacterium R33]|uniref:GNAT family N-acetyltransferase n=2 Tax=Poritiphilus flavus TaxID=2697053 RepID=A0A6L9EH53_9FLAO|nr:GNAT family N-acetyltransferase [Poritiphilus flavus]
MEGISLRNAVLEDLEVLLGFEQELIKAERPFDSTIKDDPVSYYSIKDFITDPEVELIVAEHQGKIISSGYAKEKEARSYLDHDTYAYLGFMYTVPEYRGKGVNRLIINALVEWARLKGLQEVRLTVYPGNLPAVRAYEKVGFESALLEMRISDENRDSQSDRAK